MTDYTEIEYYDEVAMCMVIERHYGSGSRLTRSSIRRTSDVGRSLGGPASADPEFFPFNTREERTYYWEEQTDES